VSSLIQFTMFWLLLLAGLSANGMEVLGPGRWFSVAQEYNYATTLRGVKPTGISARRVLEINGFEITLTYLYYNHDDDDPTAQRKITGTFEAKRRKAVEKIYDLDIKVVSSTLVVNPLKSGHGDSFNIYPCAFGSTDLIKKSCGVFHQESPNYRVSVVVVDENTLLMSSASSPTCDQDSTLIWPLKKR
jgi:hypothetical protein